MAKKKIVALTGAGISVESGIPTFSGGYMGSYNVKEVVSLEGWLKNPDQVHRFYNERRQQLGEVEPNDAHRILSSLENDFDVTVITQNVDNLHERAGSTKVIHLHGELTKACSSLHPEMVFDIGYRPIAGGEQAPDGSLLRPNIVWFGEPVRMIQAAQSIAATADIFVVIGSALTVYPAAELVKSVRANTPFYLINPNKVNFSGPNVTEIRETATIGMGKFKEMVLQIRDEKPIDVKTNIYNVVILDQSGSMESIKKEAIEGYNETLQTIKAAQKQYAETLNHFVTMVVFNGSDTKMVYDRVVCTKAEELTRRSYQPNSNTPLFDAMGSTLTKFRDTMDRSANNKVLVTIITDGFENASSIYSGQQIYQLVNELKNMGWVFTYIGADHNVEEVAKTMGVPNVLRFNKSSQGTQEMFIKERKSRERYYDSVALGKSFKEGSYFDDDEA